jgi:hypothetical protein
VGLVDIGTRTKIPLRFVTHLSEGQNAEFNVDFKNINLPW